VIYKIIIKKKEWWYQRGQRTFNFTYPFLCTWVSFPKYF